MISEVDLGVWEKLVKPQIVTPDHVAAHYAVSLLFEDQPPAFVHHHRFDYEHTGDDCQPETVSGIAEH